MSLQEGEGGLIAFLMANERDLFGPEPRGNISVVIG